MAMEVEYSLERMLDIDNYVDKVFDILNSL